MCSGLATGLPRVPQLQHGRDLINPRHRHRCAGVEHYDDIGISALGKRGDQRVLVSRQCQRFVIPAFGAFDMGKHYGGVGCSR